MRDKKIKHRPRPEGVVETRGRKPLTEAQKLEKIRLKEELKLLKKQNKKGAIKDIEYNPFYKNEYSIIAYDKSGKKVSIKAF